MKDGTAVEMRKDESLNVRGQCFYVSSYGECDRMPEILSELGDPKPIFRLASFM